MPQLVTIPLGGRDYAGQPLPEQASYLVAGQGATDALPGDPYKAPGGERPPEDGMPGDPYTAPVQAAPAPKRQVSVSEALDASLAHGATFGAAPAIAGLSAASGMQVPDITPQTGIIEALPALASPFVGAYNLLTGSGGEAYSKARDKALKDYEEIKAQRPYTTLGGELAGGIATLPVTPFTGLKAATALGRLGQGVKVGAVTGGLTGAGEATGRGESPLGVAKEAGFGAGSGAVLGGALGGTIEGVSQTARKVASLRRGHVDPELEAAKQVQEMFRGPGAEAAQRVTSDRPALIVGSETGAPLVTGDFGGRAAGSLLRRATDTSPEARDLAQQVLDPRYKQQGPRVRDWILNKFGGGDADATQQALKTQARLENKPAYRRAQLIADRMHPQGVWSPQLEQLLGAPGVGEAMQTAIQRGGNRAVSEGLGAFNPRFAFENGRLVRGPGVAGNAFPDLQLWDYTQRALRDAAKGAQRQGRDDEAGALFSLHSQLLGELDRLVPAFGDARGTAAKFFRANDALEAGQSFVSSRMQDPEARRALAKMSPAERKLFAQGFAGEIADRIGARGDSADIIGNMYVNSDRARRRIEIALGPDAARQFEAVLRVEDLMNKTRNAIGGSQTSGNLKGLGFGAMFAGASELVHGLNPIPVIAGAIALGSQAAGKKIDEKIALNVAQMLLSDNPATINRGYDIVTRNPVMRDALRRASELGVRELISRAGAYNVGAGIATMGGTYFKGGKAPETPPGKHYQQEEEQSVPSQLK